MGFMDKFKDAAAQAQQQPGAAMPDAADLEYAQLANKLNVSGLPGTATINSISETGKVDPGGSKQFAIGVAVELESGASYETTVNQFLIEAAVPAYSAGARFEAKADPDDNSKVLLFGAA